MQGTLGRSVVCRVCAFPACRLSNVSLLFPHVQPGDLCCAIRDGYLEAQGSDSDRRRVCLPGFNRADLLIWGRVRFGSTPRWRGAVGATQSDALF